MGKHTSRLERTFFQHERRTSVTTRNYHYFASSADNPPRRQSRKKIDINFTTVPNPHFRSTPTQSPLSFLALSTTSDPRCQAPLQLLFSRTSLPNQNTYLMDNHPDLYSITRCTPSHYRSSEPTTKIIFLSHFCIQRAPDLYHRIFIQNDRNRLLQTTPQFTSILSPHGLLFPCNGEILIQPWHRLSVASLCNMRNKSLPFCQTNHAYPVHDANTTRSTTYCSYERNNRREDVPSSKKRGTNARPMLSTTIQHIIRQGRYSVQPPLTALRVFQAWHITLYKILICIEAHSPPAKEVTPFRLRLVR